MEEADSQSSRVGSRDVTPDTSLSQRIDGKAFKKPKKRARSVELHQPRDADWRWERFQGDWLFGKVVNT